ncbi:DNA primase [Methylohalomonas lacus]|uniref:DNA primase n=1 Tax=Methylohalomonas lacus TaxID=398773 RepID=A0AAE3HNX7_9GAMM|nr:DNA primase [Methylohalomonas lacus]MCS3904262.1 DNA primase [Methylohalomonas lacus]
MAGLIPQHFIDDLLSRIDIVDVIDGYVPLKRAGRNHQARCPFHDEKTPSFTVSQEKQFYHCFGCGANGTAIGFLMEHAGMTFPEAVEELANRVGLTVPREGGDSTPRSSDDKSDFYELMEMAVRYYSRQLREHPERERAIAYLKQRGLSGELAAEFEIGFAPPGWDNLLSSLGKSEDSVKRLASIGLLVEKESGRGHYDRFRDRIMFPIRDRRGRAIGFGGRVLGDGEPKYLNSPETPIFHKGSETYGLYQAKKAMRQLDRFYIVEGYTDVLALAQSGVRNAVATLGTACTKEHLELLFRHAAQLVLCFDGDSAGQKAAFKAMETALPLLRDGREVDFLFLPPADDPDTFVRREGQAAFTDPARLTPLSDYLIQYLRREIDTSSREGKAKLSDRAMRYTRQLPSDSLRDLMVRKISDITFMDEHELQRQLGNDTPAAAPRGPRHSGRRHAPSLVSHTIALLLQQPALAQEVDNPQSLARVDMPGMAFLVELLEFIHAHPNIKTAGILEHWRDSRYGRRLSELAATDFDEQVNLAAEFRDCVTRLQKLQRGRRLQELRQIPWPELSEAQKEELRALTSAPGPAE